MLDLKQDSGRKALFKLAETADVLMHNYRPDPAKRLGVEYEAFEAINPRLVYVAAYGYRAAGPDGRQGGLRRHHPGGLGSRRAAERRGRPAAFPADHRCRQDELKRRRLGPARRAVRARADRQGPGGRGADVRDLVSFVMVEHLYGETFMPALDTAGYKRVLNKERRPYPSKDGYFALLPYTDGHWREFCGLVGRDELAGDPRFQGMANRLKNVEHTTRLSPALRQRTNAEWVELLDIATCPHGPVNTLDDLFVDPQLVATGYWQEVDHPTEGKLRMPGIPPRFSKTKPEIGACSRGSASTASRCCARPALRGLKSTPC